MSSDLTQSSVKSIFYKEHFRKYLNVDKKQYVDQKAQAKLSSQRRGSVESLPLQEVHRVPFSTKDVNIEKKRASPTSVKVSPPRA